MEWLILAAVSAVYAGCCWLTYSEASWRQWYFLPALLGAGLVANLAWGLLVRWFGDRQRIYVYGLFWDAALVLVWYLMPLLWFDAKLDRWGVLGLLLIGCGLVLVKVRAG